MKTTTFGKINLDIEGESIKLEVYSPRDGTVVLSLTPEELYLFLVEVGNALFEGREAERARLIAHTLLMERRKQHEDNKNTSRGGWLSSNEGDT